jgi:hypothetical protein
MAITPGSGHCSSLCTQELEMKPKHSSGLRILLLLPRLPQAPPPLLPLARSLARPPQSCCCAQDGLSGSIVYHAFVCSCLPCILMCALENVLFSAPCPLSSLSRKEGNNRESGPTSSVLATWRVFGFLIDQKKKKKKIKF